MSFAELLQGMRRDLEIVKDQYRNGQIRWREIPQCLPRALEMEVNPPPRAYKLEVDHGYEERRRIAKEKRGALKRLDIGIPSRKHPSLKMLHLNIVTRQNGALRWDPCQIAIDLEKRRIYDQLTTDSLLSEREGAGMTDVVIATIALPVTLPLRPLLAAARSYYETRERQTGMSRQAIALLKALKGQLDTETTELLTEALRNTWEYTCQMNRAVTFEEAKWVLRSCKLLMRELPADLVLPSETRSPDVDGEFTHDWLNADGDVVARCQTHSEQHPIIWVFGTEFDAEKYDARGINIRELFDCYREKDVEKDEDTGDFADAT